MIEFKARTPEHLVALHLVWDFHFARLADGQFEDNLTGQFNSNSIALDERWTVPEGWSYQSPWADDFYAACAINNILAPTRICQAMWRYDEFIVIFSSAIDPRVMTLDQFEEVLKEVDQIMASGLERDAQVETVP